MIVTLLTCAGGRTSNCTLQHPEEYNMKAAKQDALNTINQVPDNANMEEIMYQLYVLDKVRKGQNAAEEGKTLTSEELQRDIDSW